MVTNKIRLLHHPIFARLRRVPKRVYLISSLCVVAGFYILSFVVPRHVTFSYASMATCTDQFTFFPDTQRSVGSVKYAVHTEGKLMVGSVAIASTKTCVTPTTTPEPGVSNVAYSPFGGWLFRRTLVVTSSEPPKALVASELTAPVPIGKPLEVQLDSPDLVYDYRLALADKLARCTGERGASMIRCDLPALGLKQGTAYSLQLQRYFAGAAAQTVATLPITTLTATSISKASVKSGAVVYAKPRELTFTADKGLITAAATITLRGHNTPLASTTTVAGKKVTVKLANDLEREKKYVLTLKSVEATDGSTLASPYVVKFSTSGGPRVVGVSIGHTGVDRSARIVVTFDQELANKQDISKLVTISGVAANVSRSGKQLVYTLKSAGLCKSFTLSIAKGLLSKHDVAAASGWTYTARTTCHTTSIYGYSVQGRALVSYHFGTKGATTLYVGAIHGNESSSSVLMRAWINDLEANPSLYANRRIVVIPAINPDGIAAGTRTNARAVNLNRNFPTDNWEKDINDTDGYHKGGGGSSPLSEPEAKALANFTISLRPRLLISFHAIGSLVTGDPGGYSAPYAATYASMVGYRNATGQSGTFDYDITGAYEDWTYAKQGIPSMVVELSSYTTASYAGHQAAIRAMLK